MKSPLVSVIVTAYNNAEFLPKCLESLLAQTLTDIEIICINDASTDNTTEILEDFTKRDTRIRAITNDQNLGVSATRNRGIALTQAPYIMFCDGDDYYNPETCAAMYDAIHDHDVNLGISEINIIYQAHAEMKPSDDNYYSLKYSGRQTLSDDAIYNTDLAPTNKIFKKSLIEQYHLAFPEGYRFEDAYFCVAYMCIAGTAYYLNQRLYNYVRREHSAMSSVWSGQSATDIAIDHLHIAFLLYDFLEQHELLAKYNALYWRFFEAFADFAIRNSKTPARVKQVKAKALDFVHQHDASFMAASPENREHIHSLIAGKARFNPTKLKRFLIKLLPTYRLATENIQRLCTLELKHQQLLEELHQLEEKK